MSVWAKRVEEILEMGVTLTDEDRRQYPSEEYKKCKCPCGEYIYSEKYKQGEYCPQKTGKPYSCMEVWKAYTQMKKNEDERRAQRHNSISSQDKQRYEDYTCKDCSLRAYNKEKDLYYPGAYCADKTATCPEVWKSDEIDAVEAKAKAESDTEYDNFERLAGLLLSNKILKDKIKVLLEKARAYDEARKAVETDGTMDAVKNALNI